MVVSVTKTYTIYGIKLIYPATDIYNSVYSAMQYDYVNKGKIEIV
jgi:hypothetical protein